ncbi:hypothetical protein BKA83DRAFT_4178638, partial [Pisolithus microcarpus]
MEPQHLAGQASFILQRPQDDTSVGFDDEAIGKYSPSTSSVEEVAISQDGIVIALTCPTGSGKTTYIDHAVGNPDAGCGLTSSTKEVRTVQCPDSDGVRNIVLVDTPGCNNSFMTDSHVLVEIAWWLITVYENNIKLHGISCFHPISVYRIGETAVRNYNVLQGT